MSDESRLTKIRRFVELITTSPRDMQPFDDFYQDDVVIDWPQSGEVIRGKQKIRELRLALPTPPKVSPRRIVGSGDLWAIEMVFDYDGDLFYTVVIHEYKDGLVARETAYWAPHLSHPLGGLSGWSQPAQRRAKQSSRALRCGLKQESTAHTARSQRNRKNGGGPCLAGIRSIQCCSRPISRRPKSSITTSWV